MTAADRPYKILIVDDEWNSRVINELVARLTSEGWQAIVVQEGQSGILALEYITNTTDHIEWHNPDAVVLDVHFGTHKDDRFAGIEILKRIVEKYKALPVLVFTRYGEGSDRWYAETNTLKWHDADVDYIDKSASPEAVILRLRRLIGAKPELIHVGSSIVLDSSRNQVKVKSDAGYEVVPEISGSMFEIFRVLVEEWYRSPGHVIRYERLKRYAPGDQTLRTRISDIRRYISRALQVDLESDTFIINQRGVGYYLEPLDE